jgi:tetratricopeptide (TPR) repeat protein
MLVMKDQIDGRFENAISKLEKAEKDYYFFKCVSLQGDLYFNILFGNLYESLELNQMAMRYYMKAKLTTDKLMLTNPDCALVFCNLGSLMIRLREYEWAFRCYWKSKLIREYTIGGDTIDTASVYNNLGVCAFYMQIFYVSYGFFKLSFEIFKEKLG